MVKILVDYYAFLKVDRTADKETIQKAYVKAMKNYDPSKKYSAKAARRYEILDDAYIILTDDKKRKEYDALLDEATSNKKVKKSKKSKTNVNDVVDFVSDVNDKTDIISKLFNAGSAAGKARPLMTGANILIGGAMAGYGVKKGRDYIAKRRSGKNNQ